MDIQNGGPRQPPASQVRNKDTALHEEDNFSEFVMNVLQKNKTHTATKLDLEADAKITSATKLDQTNEDMNQIWSIYESEGPISLPFNYFS